MKIKLRIDQLDRHTSGRSDEFRAAVIAASVVSGDTLEIELDEWQRLTIKHAVSAKPFGLGDAVASVAQPIARTLDALLGTDIAHCSGCTQRRETLNRFMPDIS